MFVQCNLARCKHRLNTPSPHRNAALLQPFPDFQHAARGLCIVGLFDDEDALWPAIHPA